MEVKSYDKLKVYLNGIKKNKKEVDSRYKLHLKSNSNIPMNYKKDIQAIDHIFKEYDKNVKKSKIRLLKIHQIESPKFKENENNSLLEQSISNKSINTELKIEGNFNIHNNRKAEDSFRYN